MLDDVRQAAPNRTIVRKRHAVLMDLFALFHVLLALKK